MKHAITRLASLVFVLAIGLLVSGCEILSVDQPGTAPTDTTITITLQLKDGNLPGNDPDPWLLCVQTPDDWSFVSGSYDAFWRLNGTIGGSATGVGSEWQSWADTATVYVPPPAGYKWIGIRSDTGHVYGNDTLYVTATVQLKVGKKTGDFFLGYLMTKAKGNLMNPDAFAANWVDTSMNYPFKVIPSTSVKEWSLNVMPDGYALDQNYPNPFNPSTTIRYAIKEQARVRLAVYDLEGREVATLVDGMKAPGTYEVQFTAMHLSSGVYLYKLTAGNFSDVKKLVLMK